MPRSVGRARKAASVTDKSTSSSSSGHDDYGVKAKKRSTARRFSQTTKRSSSTLGKRSSGRRRRYGSSSRSNSKRSNSNSRGRVGKSQRKAPSRNENASSSSSDSYDEYCDDDSYYDQQSASSSRSCRRRRRTTSTTTRSSSGKRRRTSKTSASGKRMKKFSRSRSFSGTRKSSVKTNRRKRRSTTTKTKARRRRQQKKQSTATPLGSRKQASIHERFRESLSSLQASLRTISSSVESCNPKSSEVVLSLPIPQQTPSPAKSEDKVDEGTPLTDNVFLDDVEEQSSSIEIQATLEMEVQSEVSSLSTVEHTETQDDEETQESQVSSLGLDTSSIYSRSSSHVELPSPVSETSFQVTANSSSLKDLHEGNAVSANLTSHNQSQSPTPVGVNETVSGLLDRVEAEQKDQTDQKEEEKFLDDLVSVRLTMLKNFVSKVEANMVNLPVISNKSVVEQDDQVPVTPKSKDSIKQPSLRSLEELQEMLNHCVDCRSSSSGQSEEEEEKNDGSSKVVMESATPEQPKDKTDVEEDHLVVNHNFSDNSSLSLSIRSAD
ncbi:PREDICTED: micronuclear linker histone polyprotein-like [Rhagoletis zephyria]|uniref:micronuclear linker histone polyprotein-like n=1 Tax=Rhagoletis zephyria TaxID=28612 RepID=UPI0008118C64|nr:PREDICTED: micronuclear linker histone polyprotein-like [Rhagoletis zephyria]